MSDTTEKYDDVRLNAKQFVGARTGQTTVRIRVRQGAGVKKGAIQKIDRPRPAHPASLRGTADEIYAGLILANHGREVRTVAEWRALLDSYRNEPAHPEGIARARKAAEAKKAAEAAQELMAPEEKHEEQPHA